MRFQLNILAIIVAVVTANMRDMFPLKDRIKMLFKQGDINAEQKEYIMSKASEKMLNQQLVDRNKVDDPDYDQLSRKDASELSLWLDQEVISEHMSAETANYARAILDLGPSPYQEPNAKTLSDGPVDADYEGNGVVTKLAWRDYDPSVNGNDLYNGIWGYATGVREYALHTSHKGLNIFDVTDADDDNIFLVQTIPMTGGSIWRDVAVTEDHYAYVAAQGGNNPDFFSIDLSELSGSSPHGEGSNPISQSNIINHGYSDWGHTINAWNGLVFLNSAWALGCEILDVRDDPMNPKYVANYSNGDCHDSFAKKIYYKGELRDLFFVADGYKRKFRIYDITDIRESNFKFKKIGETPATSGIYAHENCVSDDGKTLFTFEEFNEYDIAAYDISDDAKLENPQLLSKFQYSLDNQADATVHNGFVHGTYLFVAYYAAGLRVFDISNVHNIIEVGKYDTYLDPDGNGNNNNNPTSKTEGAWNVYPYLPSGNILVSDLVYGLFVVKVEGNDNDDDNDDTTFSPTALPTFSEKPCNICDDRESAGMINKGQDCATSAGMLNKKCNKNGKWRNKKWCQESCYNSGNGYDGDVCCKDTPPTTPPPTQLPTKSCNVICDDLETNKMIKKGQDCATSTGMLNKKCNKNGNWVNKKYCQLSCYNSGNEYDGDVCCNGN